MGWSLPDVPAKPKVQPWSPWICLLIIFGGIFVALMQVVLHAPSAGLPSLASGHWLSLSGYSVAGIIIVNIFYLLRWEWQATDTHIWNGWRRNMHLSWQQQAHEHLCVVSHVLILADETLLSRLAKGETANGNGQPSLTLLPNAPVIPGIMRFEQLCRLMVAKLKSTLLQCCTSETLTILLQTTATGNKSEEIACFSRLWNAEKIPINVNIKVLRNEMSPVDNWNAFLSPQSGPVLLIAMHYRQPGEKLAEFACALLLFPFALLRKQEGRDAVRLFRPMPLNPDSLARELTDLRDMAQQPAKTKHLIWHHGLTEAAQQALGRIVNNLPLPLHADIAAGGIINVDEICTGYEAVSDWLMAVLATNMVSYGPGCHWLIQARNKQAGAMVIGNIQPVVKAEYLHAFPFPYPAGSLMLAVFFNAIVFWFMGLNWPEWLFSWSGISMLLLSLAMSLPGTVFGLRKTIACLQRKRFIQAAERSRKE